MIRLFIVLLALSCASCKSIPKTKKQVSNGIVSEQMMLEGKIRVHVATVDLTRAELEIVLANSDDGLETTSSIARRHHAPIAINGGFFSADGKPVGALKINGAWKSYPQKLRGAVGFEGDQVIFDRLLDINQLEQGAGGGFAEAGWWMRMGNILGGAPLLIANGKIIDPRPEKALQSFLENRYARTAICACRGQKAKLVVVDGGDRTANKLRSSKGMTIAELAKFLLSIGCDYALNLDGGYSSSYVENGKKLSRFSLNFLPERRISTAIIVRPRI